jgi:hypothetical protein
VKLPPAALEAEAVHPLLLVELHCNVTAWPKLTVVGDAGCAKLAVAAGGAAAGGAV